MDTMDTMNAAEVPIYIDGASAGTLTVTRSDGGAVFDAALRDVGRVVRLYVYGPDGAAGYLGVPVPEGGVMRLTRRVRGRALADYPKAPVCAAEKPPEPEPPEPPRTAAQKPSWTAAQLPEAAEKASSPEKPPSRRVVWLGGRPHYF